MFCAVTAARTRRARRRHAAALDDRALGGRVQRVHHVHTRERRPRTPRLFHRLRACTRVPRVIACYAKACVRGRRRRPHRLDDGARGLRADEHRRARRAYRDAPVSATISRTSAARGRVPQVAEPKAERGTRARRDRAVAGGRAARRLWLCGPGRAERKADAQLLRRPPPPATSSFFQKRRASAASRRTSCRPTSRSCSSRR